MRIGISGLAWDRHEDDAAAALLGQLGVNAVDITPGKYFPDLAVATRAQALAVRDWWRDRGIEITGMQALLFGTDGAALFDGEAGRTDLAARLDAICRLGAAMGATRLTFGSPRARRLAGTDPQRAFELAVEFFRQRAALAHAQGVTLCIEPVPAHYGNEFLMGTGETARLVEAVDHPGVRLQLDSGALTLNGESCAEVLHDWGHLVGHVHASEPDLAPVGEGGTDHAAFAAGIMERFPDALVTLEMLATRDEPHLVAVERALRFAESCYALPEVTT